MKSVIVEAVPRNGFAVLNADDPLVRQMQRKNAGRTIWFTLARPGTQERDMVERHCRRGGHAVVLDSSDLGDKIVLRDGPRSMQVGWTHLLPSTFGGRALMNVQNAMAAAGAAAAIGASLHDIRRGLRTFSTSFYQAPGRLNEVNVEGRTVIIDYCHNAAGMRMLGDFVDRTAQAGEDSGGERVQRLGVIASAGDRGDQDLTELGRVAAHHFDRIIVREDANTRGRAPGATAEVTKDAVLAGIRAGARCKAVECVLPEVEATSHAMLLSNPGDIVVVCVDNATDVMTALESYGHLAQPGVHELDSDLT